jgi:hypothetical protein
MKKPNAEVNASTDSASLILQTMIYFAPAMMAPSLSQNIVNSHRAYQIDNNSGWCKVSRSSSSSSFIVAVLQAEDVIQEEVIRSWDRPAQ